MRAEEGGPGTEAKCTVPNTRHWKMHFWHFLSHVTCYVDTRHIKMFPSVCLTVNLDTSVTCMLGIKKKHIRVSSPCLELYILVSSMHVVLAMY